MKSTDFLQAAIDVQAERGKQYDQPTGERSMGRTVTAFNAITGRDLTEAEGWLLLQVLKDVRQWQNPSQYHHDSALDGVAYASLKAEALHAVGGERKPSDKTARALEQAVEIRAQANAQIPSVYDGAWHQNVGYRQVTADTEVEIELRSGRRDTLRAGVPAWSIDGDHPGDIVRFRVVK